MSQDSVKSAILQQSSRTDLGVIKEKKKNLNPLPKLAGETRRDPMTKKLLYWKGQSVKYIDNEPRYQHPDDPSTYVHIYFPDGRPPPENSKDAACKPEDYTPEIEAAYHYVKEHGTFKNGMMPSIAPKPEWCNFDF
jgi:nucleoporin NUP42